MTICKCGHADWAHTHGKCEAALYGKITRYEDIFMGFPRVHCDMEVIGYCECNNNNNKTKTHSQNTLNDYDSSR